MWKETESVNAFVYRHRSHSTRELGAFCVTLSINAIFRSIAGRHKSSNSWNSENISYTLEGWDELGIGRWTSGHCREGMVPRILCGYLKELFG